MTDSVAVSAGETLILMVEDDPEISRLVSEFMRREGFRIETAPDGRAMDAALKQMRPDLIILDLMLPGEDGLSICRRLRNDGATPILMLTAKSDEVDRIVGLEIGADDYLAKPFAPRELLARVRAILRRSHPPRRPQANRRLAFDRLVIDLDARDLAFAEPEGASVSLTSAEFDLLACFVQRPRRVLTRDQILDFTRGRCAEPFDRTVDMLISRLRKKLDAVSPGASLIVTVRNGGYLFTAPVSEVS
jgi:two-component system OmpR family response regulator